MDLNINNYSIDELCKLFHITDNKLDILKIEDYLSKTIELITIQDEDGLPEKKEKIIKFYNTAAAKLLNVNVKLKPQSAPTESTESTESIDSINYFKENEKLLSFIETRTTMNSTILPEDLVYNEFSELQKKNNEPAFVKGYVSTYTEGVVNPLERELTRSVLSINSKFRDHTSKSSTDFIIELSDPYHNVVSMTLASIEYINSYYTISEYLRTNTFSVTFFQYHNTITTNELVQNSFTEVFTIPDGNYTLSELVTIINNDCFKNNETNIATIASIQYYRVIQLVKDNATGKVRFLLNDFSGNQPPQNYNWGFHIDFSDKKIPNRPAFLNFGWILGYKKLYYNFFKTTSNEVYYNHTKKVNLNIGYNPESIANTLGTRYFLLEVDDFNKNQSKLFRFNAELKNNTSEAFTYSVSNILALIPNRGNYYDKSFEDVNEKLLKTKLYFGPVKISKLKIRLLDENGVVVNFNNMDLTINITFETINKPHTTLAT
jgi:hypothetical protein